MRPTAKEGDKKRIEVLSFQCSGKMRGEKKQVKDGLCETDEDVAREGEDWSLSLGMSRRMRALMNGNSPASTQQRARTDTVQSCRMFPSLLYHIPTFISSRSSPSETAAIPTGVRTSCFSAGRSVGEAEEESTCKDDVCCSVGNRLYWTHTHTHVHDMVLGLRKFLFFLPSQSALRVWYTCVFE